MSNELPAGREPREKHLTARPVPLLPHLCLPVALRHRKAGEGVPGGQPPETEGGRLDRSRGGLDGQMERTQCTFFLTSIYQSAQ